MKDRIKYLIIFLLLLATEVAIGMKGTGFIRAYVGDVLVIPTIYFMLRCVFSKDSTFSVYVLPMLCYCLGWFAESIQALNLTDRLGISRDSALGIMIGSTFDIKDAVSYFFGLMLIGLYLAVETRWKDDRRWWYPIGVFLHLTWGSMQTVVGFFMYLIYIRCPHEYYGGVVKTAWNKNSGISMGLFIFTPYEPDRNDSSDDAMGRMEYCSKVTVHEYGHTFQALLLGPLYLIIIGIPSISWGSFPPFIRFRERKKLRYTWMFCEGWASRWGEKVTGKEAIWD